ncbi:MAG: methylenetetrahydrofolate reductase C-terminal domain-containing protein [Dehalococcoidia bacterium]|nr:methylenetetrahydrofolate reductase C-terminal domain-containing protein [Dehalococcoidia bacterium]MDZ4246234.1 methylenetetrahydrofolate reductase C-terminal domain-containing protein [Dehalococcoidia bacterium]
MIVGEQKPLAEIKNIVAPYSKILILGCGTCVKTCFAGGEDEVATLASALRLSMKKDGREIKIDELTVERQCEDEFLRQAASNISGSEAVLSLACGAGVQMVADRFKKTPALPGVNTTFIGILEKQGLFTEKCLGCGDCVLDRFAGICPVTCCSKKLLNGPCGGSQNGKCEVNSDIECAWQNIIDRYKALGQMDRLTAYYPARDWRNSSAGGLRKLVREDHVI